MRIFGGERLRNLMERLGLPDDQPIEHSLVSRSIESAQRRVEGHNFDIRKHLVEYDDVMNKQREVLYKMRRRILALESTKDNFLHEEILKKFSPEEQKEYKEKTAKVPIPTLFELERRVYLSVIDQLWVEHLNTMDQLRDSIGLRGYGQVDPLIAYKEESLRLFRGLLQIIDDEALAILMKINFSAAPPPPPAQPKPAIELKGADEAAGSAAIEQAAGTVSTDIVSSPRAIERAPESMSSDSLTKGGVTTSVRAVGEKMNSAISSDQTGPKTAKVGRNDPCPCGAKKPDGRPVKYKHCHGR